MKVKILRNGKVCDMPDQNAEAYIKSGQAVAVEEAKAFVAPVKDKKMRAAPKTKEVESEEYVCELCGRKFTTAAGLAVHSRFCKEKED